MSTAPSQKELLELEQNEVSALQFLKAAATFLRCDLEILEILLLENNSTSGVRKSTAPREEFVLKLLLKRLSHGDDVLDRNFWILLAHLSDTISVRNLAHLLGERDFFKLLDHALEKALVSAVDHEQVWESEASSDENSGRPTKKRKHSSHPLVRCDADQDPLPVLICQSVARLVQLAEGGTEVEEISSNAVRNVLSAIPEDAAAVIEKLLKLTAIASGGPEKRQKRLMGSIPATLMIWKYRRPEIITAGGKSSDQHFTTHCLRPALRLIDQLTRAPNKSSDSTVAVSNLERLVALHSVLPLRALFHSEKAQQWKAKTPTVTWDDIKDLHTVLDTMLLSTETELTQGDASSWILKYYNIATRAISRSTMRRAQLEQPWLDCLFCSCVYLGCSKFPKMILDEAGHLVSQSPTNSKTSIGLNSYTEELFSLATTTDVKLSLPVLHYFMTAAAEMLPETAAWLIMVRIVEQDVSVLVPSSGLLDSRALLDRIFDAVSIMNETDDEVYVVVRDGLFRPMLDGFAQSRDLQGFISLWLRGLQDSIQQRASGDLQCGKKHLSFVWEDDTLFQDFETAVKALTSPNLTLSLITKTLELLKDAAKRVGPTADIVSHVAIATSLLSARLEDLNTATLESIFEATVSALSRRSDYQLQRWRLWRLLRQCYAAGKPAIINEHLLALTQKNGLMSLSIVSDIGASPQSYARDAKMREAIECFHLTILRTTQTQEVDKAVLETEIDYLINFFSQTILSRQSKSTTNTGSAEIDLSLSCVGIILQHPQVLQNSQSVISRLVAAMIQSIPPSTDVETDRDVTSIIKSLLLSEEISSKAELFNSCCSVLANVLDAHDGISSSARSILIALPLQALKKSLAQKIADVLVKRIRADGLSLDDTLADLGLLEMLTTHFSVSPSKPKKWAEFVDFAEHVLKSTSPPESQSFQVALGCISTMFDTLSSRCEKEETSQETLIGLSRFKSRLQELIQATRPDPLQQRPVLQTSDEGFELSEVKNEALEQIATRIYAQVSSLGQEKSSVLTNLVEKDMLDSRDFLMLSAIVCQLSANEISQHTGLHQSLSELASLKFALKAHTVADLSLAFETCKIILEKHPSTTNQHTLETLLSSITTLTSPMDISIPSSHPAATFNRLCYLLGFTLSRHRKRLGGRHHLLLPALQGLLRCLFFAGTSAAPPRTKSQILFLRTLPAWLRTSAHPLPPSSAAQLTRLLTTLSDPPSSSLRSRKSSELTDATKKAKSLAGQHLQYLIQAYCSFSLQGQLPSASKDKLLPGLYGVLAAMDREVMRGMNGGMDSSGRAIFKSLYDEYQRYGRWDRK